MEKTDGRREGVASIRVLVVDDSAFIRRVFRQELSKDPDIEVVATAPNPYVARNKILDLAPDVLTLDIEMPRMDGIVFLRKIMRYMPMPVVVVSSLTREGGARAVEAMAAGAFDVVGKPVLEQVEGEFAAELVSKIKAAYGARGGRQYRGFADLKPRPIELPRNERWTRRRVVAVGASTGGTEALAFLLSHMPLDAPPILVVQHMPEHFTRSFAARLDKLSAIRVKEAEEGDVLEAGLAIVARGDRHMLLVRRGERFCIVLRDGPLVSRHRPSVNVLFKSVARVCSDGAVGVLLTGMGRDGAEGLLQLREAGARTIAQDEESSVVYGMPKEAVSIGAAEQVLPLDAIPRRMLECAMESRLTGKAGSVPSRE